MDNNENKCFHNKDYERIKKKIEEQNKNIKYCYVQGPTGPQGLKGEKGDTGDSDKIVINSVKTGDPDTEAQIIDNKIDNVHSLDFIIPKGEKGENGPTTINVGTTETIEPDLSASVTNSGTDKDVILNFKIPRGQKGETGEKGETGPIGPRGLPGEIGISQAITIDETITVESNEEAAVQDDFESNVHHLTFYIPKGEVGPTGPKGEKGDPKVIGAYGERYSNSSQRFNVKANTETIIPLEQTGPALFVEYDTSYAIGLKRYGMFKMTYFLNIATSVDTNYVICIKASGTKLPSSDIKVQSKANTINNISGSIIYGLIENDEITLVITTDQDTDLIFDGTTCAKLSISELD